MTDKEIFERYPFWLEAVYADAPDAGCVVGYPLAIGRDTTLAQMIKSGAGMNLKFNLWEYTNKTAGEGKTLC